MCANKGEEVHWMYLPGTLWKELEDPVKSWEDLCRTYDFFREKRSKFIFRGQSEHGNLKTSLERAFREFGIEGNTRRSLEKKLIRTATIA